jgi:hypothetical protein
MSVAVWTIVAAVAAVTAAATARFRPVDEAPLEPPLVAVRAAAIESLRARDVERLLDLVDESVETNDQGQAPKAGIRFVFDAARADRVIEALSLGGSFTFTRGSTEGERQFCAPYVYSAFPSEYPRLPNRDDEPWAVIAKDVAVKTRPAPSAAVIAHVGYQLVWVAPAGVLSPRDGSSWREIELTGGRAGFVPARTVRSPGDYHVCFANRTGRWKIVAMMRDVFPSD